MLAQHAIYNIYNLRFHFLSDSSRLCVLSQCPNVKLDGAANYGGTKKLVHDVSTIFNICQY